MEDVMALFFLHSECLQEGVCVQQSVCEMRILYGDTGTVILYIDIFIYVHTWNRVLSFVKPYVGVRSYLVIIRPLTYLKW